MNGDSAMFWTISSMRKFFLLIVFYYRPCFPNLCFQDMRSFSKKSLKRASLHFSSLHSILPSLRSILPSFSNDWYARRCYSFWEWIGSKSYNFGCIFDRGCYWILCLEERGHNLLSRTYTMLKEYVLLTVRKHSSFTSVPSKMLLNDVEQYVILPNRNM